RWGYPAAAGREAQMVDVARKADGRRIFTVEFKRGVVQQLLKGEKTLAEIARELDVQPNVVRQWKRRFEAGAHTAVAANDDVVPASALRDAHQRIRELERLLGKKQMEIEILQAAREVVKKSPWLRKGPGGDTAPDRRDLPHARDRAADGVLSSARPPLGLVPPRGRRDRAATDPGGDKQSGDLRLSPRLGAGEPDLPRRLQPQADSPRDADARVDAGAATASPARSATRRPGAAAGVESALVLGYLADPVLERRSGLGGVRDRLSRSRRRRLDRVAAAPERRRHPDADGQGALGAVRRDDVGSAPRDPVAQRQRPAVHRDGLGLLRPRAGASADHDAGVQPREQRVGRRLRAHLQT